jgi:tetratricopeptide (TPR) repeat protein
VETFKFWSDAYSKNPKNAEAAFKLAQKYDRRYVREKALELYKQAVALDRNGTSGTTDYGKSKVTYTQYAEFSIGTLSLFAGPRSTAPLKDFIRKAPEGALLRDAYRRLAGYYRYSGTKDKAIEFYEEYAAHYPEEAYAYDCWAGRILRDRESRDADKGIELIEKIRDLTTYNPDPTALSRNLADLYMLKGDPDKAKESYGERFVNRQIGLLTSSLVQYAQFWMDKNTNLESALTAVETALKFEPDMIYVLQTAAGLYMKLGQESKALAIYGPEFSKKNADKAGPLYGYSRFWLTHDKNLESALAAARRSVELDAGTWFYWDTLAGLEAKFKNFAAAVKAQEKAVATADEETKPSLQKKLDQYKADAAKEKK